MSVKIDQEKLLREDLNNIKLLLKMKWMLILIKEMRWIQKISRS